MTRPRPGSEDPATPAIAVVVVNYNAGDHLLRCLASLEASNGGIPFEGVVVDNASRDGSAERALAVHPWVRVLQNRRNLGFAAAANRGIRATAAELILLLNPDADVRGGTLAGLVKVAGERPSAGAIGVMVHNPDGSIQPSARKVPTLAEGLGHSFLHPFLPDNRWSRAYTMAGWNRESEREVEWVSGSCMLLRRRALAEVGLFDEGYFMYVEDVDLCTRLRAAGWQVIFSPELEVSHVVGVSSGRSPRMAFEHSRSIYRYFRKFHGAAGAALAPFVWFALKGRAGLVAAQRLGARATPAG